MDSFPSKYAYCSYNQRIIQKEREAHKLEKEDIYYTVNVQYFRPYRMYYLIIPREYLNNIDTLRKNKNDIFAKGKILTFTYYRNHRRPFKFDAVIDSQEEHPYRRNIVYVNLVPIKERYRYRKARELLGIFKVKERNGDLTFDRMENALDEFEEGDCCSKNIERYILGKKNIRRNNMEELFNFDRFFPTRIRDYYILTQYQINKINTIFNRELTTISIHSEFNKRLISLIIYAIYQMRNYQEDQILICSSSNSSADDIALELLNFKKYIKKLDILRIYAKNQELVERNAALDDISYHKLKIKEENRRNNFGGRNLLVEKNDIIISTCVNSYCDEIINYHFPFVIIVDADNSNENENLIPLTLNSQHVVLISYDWSQSDQDNLYQRMKHLYPENHIKF